MSDLDLFDPQVADMEIISFPRGDNDCEIRKVIVDLVKDAETCIPKGQKLTFLFCYNPKTTTHDPLGQRSYVGWSYEPYPSPPKKMSVRHARLDTYFQKLWKQPMPHEFNYPTNWTLR